MDHLSLQCFLVLQSTLVIFRSLAEQVSSHHLFIVCQRAIWYIIYIICISKIAYNIPIVQNIYRLSMAYYILPSYPEGSSVTFIFAQPLFGYTFWNTCTFFGGLRAFWGSTWPCTLFEALAPRCPLYPYITSRIITQFLKSPRVCVAVQRPCTLEAHWGSSSKPREPLGHGAHWISGRKQPMDHGKLQNIT